MFIITCKSKSFILQSNSIAEKDGTCLISGFTTLKAQKFHFYSVNGIATEHVRSTCLSLRANQNRLYYSQIALLKRMVHVLLVGLPPSKHRSFIFTVSMALLQNMSVHHVYHYVQIKTFILQSNSIAEKDGTCLISGFTTLKAQKFHFYSVNGIATEHVRSTCLSLRANQNRLYYSQIALLKRMVHVLLVGLPPSKHRSFIFTVSMALLQNMSVLFTSIH